MAEPLELQVLTPGKRLLHVEEVSKVRLRLADHAWLSIYPGHAPILAETMMGPLEYTSASEDGVMELAPGILQVRGSRVTIYTSGRAEAAPDLAAEIFEDTGAERFDRLARELLVSLKVQPSAAVPGADDEAE